MPPKKPISDDDINLFRDAVGEVKPIDNDKHEQSAKKPPAVPLSHLRDNLSVMDELLSDFSELDLLETGEHLAYTAPGVQRSVLKKLKAGKYSIQAEIDLHGFTKEESRKHLREFLHEAQERQHYCVRIIHGKGRKNAEQAPVLKPAVAGWLSRYDRVLAYCSARISDGGTGSLYVLLKKKNV